MFAITLLLLTPTAGDAVISAPAGGSRIVITTTSRLAGAVHSLTWGGREFVDSFDHGRQIQAASNFDCGRRFVPETFNPTEAGSRADGRGPTSTSRLLKFRSAAGELWATSRMAHWLRPGEKSLGSPARNRKSLSAHTLRKHIKIGADGLPHAVRFDVTFTVPAGEGHTYAQFEALTGYTPPAFSKFWKFQEGRLGPLSDGPGEQSHPVVLATPEGSHAIGISAPRQSPQPGYGRFRFRRERVNKWNCVFRHRDSDGIKPGDYKFRCYVAVGTLKDVERTLRKLEKREGD